MNLPDPRLAPLLQRPDLWRGDMLAHPLREEVKSGFAELDAVLPGGGWPRGTLTELLSDGEGMGEVSLLLPALVALEAETGWIALVAPPWLPHAPSWQAVGMDLSRLLVVRAGPRDAAWACEQLLASGACAAVLAWLPQIDARALRRLQLAGAARRSLAFVFRPAAMAASASPAALRLSLAAGTTGLAVRILKRRGSPLVRRLSLAVARPVAWTRLGANDQAGARAPAGFAQLALS